MFLIILDGKIVSVYVDSAGEKLYHIVYRDGDEEDIHFRRCRFAIILYDKIHDSDSDESD